MTSSSLKTEAQKEVWQVIMDINNAWVSGHAEDIMDWLHEDMVVFHTEFGRLGKGKEACVNSYKYFTEQAIIHDFKESDPTVDIYGNTAVVTYRFEIDYEANGETIQDASREMFVLTREADKWKAVWQTMIPLPEEE